MFTNRLFYGLIMAMLLITACAPQSPATPNANSVPVATTAPDKPIALRLAVSDAQDNPSGSYALEFIQQVKALSNGNITVEPVWQAGDSTDAGFEMGVIQLVKKGDIELGLAASRAFDMEDIKSFEALQTPFLITNDNLAKAVATSDISVQMLDHLKSSGLAGLTLWPEDLRHPFSVVPGKPLLSPEDFAGLNIRTTPSNESNKLMEALGGKPIYADSDYQGAESGLRQGSSLTGTPTATGNVTFFAKYQVLFANGAAYEKLSDNQRSILHDAAIATQKKAIAEHPSDADAGSAWCKDGGTIVLASDAQVAAFEKASQSVFDSIAQDTFNAQAIAAIHDLKTKTAPSSGAQACAPVAQASPVPTEIQVWSQGLLPNGVWQVKLSPEDLMAVGGILQSAANEQAGIQTFAFHNGKFTWHLEADHPGNSGDCEGTYALVGDVNRLTLTGDCAPEVDDIQWRLDDQGLHLHLAAIKNAPFAEIKANLEAKPYQKIANQ